MQGVVENAIRENVSAFIGGMESKTLSKDVMSGHIHFENTWVQPDVFQALDFPVPIQIVHSNIEAISLEINWANISNSPVKLLIEGITLIFRPQCPFAQEDPYWLKTNMLLNLAQSIEKKFRKNKETSSASLVSKLTQKVFDNVQVTIKDVHIRFENESKLKSEEMTFSFGLTVESFKMFTTDQARKQTWLDRTAKNKQNEPMFKLVELSSLKVYFYKKDELMGKSDSKASTQDLALAKQLKELIGSEKSSDDGTVCKISSQFFLALRPDEALTEEYLKLGEPQNSISLEFEPIYLKVPKEIVQVNMALFEMFGEFKKFLDDKEVESKISLKFIVDELALEQAEKDFLEGFLNILKARDKSKRLSVLGEEEITKYRAAIEKIYSTKGPEHIRILVNDLMLSELKKRELQEKETKKNASGFFSFGSKKTEHKPLTPGEIAEVEKFIDANFPSIQGKKPLSHLPADFILNAFEFKQKEGHVIFFHNPRGPDLDEGVSASFEGLTFSLRQQANQNLIAEVSLGNFGAKLFADEESGISNSVPVVVCPPSDKKELRVKLILDREKHFTKLLVSLPNLDLIASLSIPKVALPLLDLKSNDKFSMRVAVQNTMNSLKAIKNDAYNSVEPYLKKGSFGFDLEVGQVRVLVKPLIYLTIDQGSLHTWGTKQNMKGELSVSLKCSIYNPKCSRYEPVLEPVTLQANLSTFEKQNERQQLPGVDLKISAPKNKSINFNISGMFFQEIYKSYIVWQRIWIDVKSRKKHPGIKEETLNKDHLLAKRSKSSLISAVTSLNDHPLGDFLVFNETGYPMTVIQKVKEKITETRVENGSLKPLTIQSLDALERSSLTRSVIGTMFSIGGSSGFQVQIEHPKRSIDVISNIDPEGNMPREYRLRSRTGDLLGCGDIITSAKTLHEARVMTIASKASVQNSTQKDILLVMKNSELNSQVEVILKAGGSKTAVPFDFVLAEFQLSVPGEVSLEKPPTLLFSSFLFTKNFSLFSHTIQLSKKSFVEAVLKREPDRRTTIILRPFMVVRNALPLCLTLQISGGNKDSGAIRRLHPGEETDFDLQALPRVASNMNLKVKGHKLLEKPISLLEDGRQIPESIEIVDDLGIVGEIRSDVTCGDSKFPSYMRIVFYACGAAINETLNPSLEFYLCEVKKRSKEDHLAVKRLRTEIAGKISKMMSKKSRKRRDFTLSSGQFRNKGEDQVEDRVTLLSFLIPRTVLTMADKTDSDPNKTISTPVLLGTSTGIDYGSILEDNKRKYESEFCLRNTMHPVDPEFNPQLFTRVIQVSPRFIVQNESKCLVTLTQFSIGKNMLMTDYSVTVEPESKAQFEKWSLNSGPFERYVCIKVDISGEFYFSKGPISFLSRGSTPLALFRRGSPEPQLFGVDTKLEKGIYFMLLERIAGASTHSMSVLNDTENVRLFAFQSVDQERGEPILPDSPPRQFGWSYPIYEKILMVDIEDHLGKKLGSFTIHANSSSTTSIVQTLAGTYQYSLDIKKNGQKTLTIVEASASGTPRRRHQECIPEFQSGAEQPSLSVNLPRVSVSLITNQPNTRVEIINATLENASFFIREYQELLFLDLNARHFQVDFCGGGPDTTCPVLLGPDWDNPHYLSLLKGESMLSAQLVLPTWANSKARPVIHRLRAALRPSFVRVDLELISQATWFAGRMGSLLRNIRFLKEHGHKDLYFDKRVRLTNQIQSTEIEWKLIQPQSREAQLHINELVIYPVLLDIEFQGKSSSSTTRLERIKGFILRNIPKAKLELSGIRASDVLSAPRNIKETLKEFYKSQATQGYLKSIMPFGVLSLIGKSADPSSETPEAQVLKSGLNARLQKPWSLTEAVENLAGGSEGKKGFLKKFGEKAASGGRLVPDFISKSFIPNNPEQGLRWVRIPRAFYGKPPYFSVYDQSHSEDAFLLKKIDGKKFDGDSYVFSEALSPGGSSYTLFFTLQHLLLVSGVNSKVCLDVYSLKKVLVKGKTLQIFSDLVGKAQKVEIDCSNGLQAEKIAAKINQYLQNYYF